MRIGTRSSGATLRACSTTSVTTASRARLRAASTGPHRPLLMSSQKKRPAASTRSGVAKSSAVTSASARVFPAIVSSVSCDRGSSAASAAAPRAPIKLLNSESIASRLRLRTRAICAAPSSPSEFESSLSQVMRLAGIARARWAAPSGRREFEVKSSFVICVAASTSAMLRAPSAPIALTRSERLCMFVCGRISESAAAPASNNLLNDRSKLVSVRVLGSVAASIGAASGPNE
eukprot:Amastigsp_a176454_20.p2 type:complete len:233 gc:universal Amastigsp_a176454_20:53-751(+)